MKKILSYCRPYTLFVFITMVIKTVGTLMDLFIPYLLGYILDEVVPRCTRENFTQIFYWGGAMVLCAVIALVGNITANHRSCLFSKKVIIHLRGDLFRKILSFSAAQTDAFTIPSLVARMSTDTYSLSTMLSTMLRAGMRAPLLLIGGVLVTLSIEPVLSLSFIALLPLMAGIVIFISRKGIRLFRAKQERVDAMVEKIRDTFTGIRVIRALSKVEKEKESFQKINYALSRSEEKANITMATSKPVTNVSLNLGMTAVVALGAWRVHAGFTTPGQIISFMSYFTIILNATLMLTRIFTVCTKGVASAQRIQEVLEEGEDLVLLPPSPAEEGAPFLEFRNVSFSYHKTTPVLENVSFTLNRGETLGIIGGTGSGKSTLIHLLMRFYDPDEGAIYFEGHDLRTIPPEKRREMFGVVLQHDFLISDTLEENIRFGRDISREEMERAAADAQALPFISDLEAGFDHTLTTKGANLSGGQRQRVLISRALAGHGDVLILDDASSALDYKTDANLRRALGRRKDATRVIVAQRISSIHAADLILVLENGQVVGQGKHGDLMESCAIYKEIAQSQMGEVVK